MREAASRVLLESLWAAGRGCGHDRSRTRMHAHLRQREDLCCARPAADALRGADALAIVNRMAGIPQSDFDAIKGAFRPPVISMAAILYDPEQMARAGFTICDRPRQTFPASD